MYRKVDGYSHGCSLVEDEDGLRVLLVPAGDGIPASVWGKAILKGAIGLLRYDMPRYVLREVFDEYSTIEASEGLYALEELWWSPLVPESLKEAQIGSQPRSGPSPYVSLHTHSEFSPLDGLSTMDELVKAAVADGQTALAVTDHGGCWGAPALQAACDAGGIKPIFGMEAYFVNDRFSREDAKDYQHICVWAMNPKGLENLWAISTEGYRDGFHGHPRIDWDTLARLNEGIIVSSGCLRGPLANPYLNGRENEALVNLSRFKELFGDRFYIEIHANQLPDQIKVNKWLVEQAKTFDIPMIAAVDSHYATEEDRDNHQIWLSIQINKDVADESSLFGGGQNYHMMTEGEVRDALDYLGTEVANVCVSNTGALAERCNARIVAKHEMPVFSVGEDAEQQDIDKMFQICMDNWEDRVIGKSKAEDIYFARFEREIKLLVEKGFAGYFLMVSDQVNYAKANGVLVGPGRGSGAASLVAYLMGITEIDPVEYDLLFERFMTEGRTSLPDFDIDYPSSKKQFMFDYTKRRWSESKVSTVGTHGRLKNKSVFRDTARAIKSRLPEGYFQDVDEISALIKGAEAGTAGLGLSWDELMNAIGDELEPYRQRMPELFRVAETFRGRLRSYGKHAAGVIIDPKHSLEGSFPMMLANDGVTLVTQWDMAALEPLGYIKFDYLNLRTLDTLQETLDLIRSTRGIDINVSKWCDEYKDPSVFGEICSGFTLGMFQIETNLGTRTTARLNPTSLPELADVITIGRPGPMRSGLADTYFRRRNGDEDITYPDQRLKGLLEKRYGCMLYQEDIMGVCLILAGYSSDEADDVRKILGKKKVDLVAAAGKKFEKRAVDNATDAKVAKAIWEQMAEFARYSFNLGHAQSYATITYWTAWFKHYYPIEFITSCLSSVKPERIPEFVNETRRMGYKVLPPDINVSNAGFTANGDEIRYGIESIKNVGVAATSDILAKRPFTSWDDLMERKDSQKFNATPLKALARVGAFDKLRSNRRALVLKLEDTTTGSQDCIFLRPDIAPNGLPCNYDWDSEPLILGRTGKPLKNQKPLPKKCSRACRQYTPRPETPDEDIEPYTDKEIRDIEFEALGVFLSSSPFDIIPEEEMELLATADQLRDQPSGNYFTAIFIMDVRRTFTRDGKPMAFVKASTPSGDLDLTVFSERLKDYGGKLVPGCLALADISKNSRGYQLSVLEEI